MFAADAQKRVPTITVVGLLGVGADLYVPNTGRAEVFFDKTKSFSVDKKRGARMGASTD